jgi:diguanylate cyclase (GGDEF)-like protein
MATLLVRPQKLARAFGISAPHEGPVVLGFDGAALVVNGPPTDAILQFAGGSRPVVTDGGARLVFPLRRSGVCIDYPDAKILNDVLRMTVLQGMAELAGGALHAAARADEAHRKAKALELARARLDERNRLLSELLVVDELTGVHNRRHFQQRLDEEVRRSQRYGRPVALMLFDLDHFKQINDGHGHPTGDVALRHVAQCARRVARRTDLVARLGGDEFAILMPETDPDGGLQAAHRLRGLISGGPAPRELRDIRITVSIGIAGSPRAWTAKAEELIAAADEALYKSKEGGRNRATRFVEGAA